MRAKYFIAISGQMVQMVVYKKQDIFIHSEIGTGNVFRDSICGRLPDDIYKLNSSPNEFVIFQVQALKLNPHDDKYLFIFPVSIALDLKNYFFLQLQLCSYQ